jgi:hypothetical protein
MGIFRAIGEVLFYSTKNQFVGIILNDVQTRISSDTIDFNTHFSKINMDSFVDVNELTTLLANRNILVRRSQEDNNQIRNTIISCRRYPRRHMLPNESRDTGIFIAKSFPFAKNILKIASCIIGLMSFYPRWKVIHLRIEDELMHFLPGRDVGLETHTKNELQQTIHMISSTPNLSAVYIASGIREEKYNHVVNTINEQLPELTITRKEDILKGFPEIKEEFESLCLEEQALVDWLVCLGAPFFAGPHSSSFAYLAGYMRHYRGFDKETTHLWPDYQPYWDAWFPRV